MNEWIDRLRPGDEVSVVRGWRRTHDGGKFCHLAKVERKTPTLVITDDGNRWRRKDGTKYAEKGVGDRSWIVPVTDKHREHVEHSTLCRTLGNLGVSDWRQLDLKSLRTIDAIRRGRPLLADPDAFGPHAADTFHRDH